MVAAIFQSYKNGLFYPLDVVFMSFLTVLAGGIEVCCLLTVALFSLEWVKKSQKTALNAICSPTKL